MVSFCAGASFAGGSPTNNFGGACLTPNMGFGGINGLARFTKTTNQFGGISTGRTLGTAKVYFNVGGINPSADLPCTGGFLCQFALSTVIPNTTAVAGGPFGGTVIKPAFMTPTGVFTGTIGFNGTILGVGNVVTTGGVFGFPVPFTGQFATSVGFPLTTGKLTISVTIVLPGEPVEVFKREGADARDANGNGVIALNTGSISRRTISRGNANRTWMTLEIPEPSAILATSAGLFALFGCHQWVRRRSC